MSKIKSLADQLREQMATPGIGEKISGVPAVKKSRASVLPVKTNELAPDILSLIMAYDSAENKSMIHVKLDANTARLVGHFKMATGIDNIKLGAFAIRYLFDTHPELKTYIKNFIQNLDI